VRFCSDAQIASAYGLRDSRVGTDKGKKPREGAESITKVDTLPKTRFKTARLHPSHQRRVPPHAFQRTACPGSDARLPPYDRNPGTARCWG
jgi:hypothetical protein